MKHTLIFDTHEIVVYFGSRLHPWFFSLDTHQFRTKESLSGCYELWNRDTEYKYCIDHYDELVEETKQLLLKEAL